MSDNFPIKIRHEDFQVYLIFINNIDPWLDSFSLTTSIVT